MMAAKSDHAGKRRSSGLRSVIDPNAGDGASNSLGHPQRILSVTSPSTTASGTVVSIASSWVQYWYRMFSTLSSYLPFGTPVQTIDLPSVEIHEIEIAHEKSARRLKHLLKLNHAAYGILFNDLKFHNHTPHLLGSAYLLGGDADHLNNIFEEETSHLDPWQDAPGEISDYDWRDFLGKKEYERAFVDFFEDQLLPQGYDWRKVVNKFMFEGKEPLINCIVAGLGHPLIHFGYALELSSREVGIEALALAATCYNDMHKYIDNPKYYNWPSSYKSTTSLDILKHVADDSRFNSSKITVADPENADVVYAEHEEALLDNWSAWNIKDPVTQFAESQKTATAILVATVGHQYDFFFCHILTTSHACRILFPLIPTKFHIPLVRQWLLLTITTYVSQLRPEIKLSIITDYDLKGKDWKWVEQKAIHGKHAADAHYIKAIRAMREAANTWGDDDQFYLKAAAKFADEFSGWGGFGSVGRGS